MADDVADTVITALRYSSRQRSKQMLLEGCKIVDQSNGVTEPSHVTCQLCDQSFPNMGALQSHERVCSDIGIESLRTKSVSVNRRSKAPPRKINVDALNGNNFTEDVADEPVISEMHDNFITPNVVVAEDQSIDPVNMDSADLALAVNQEQLDPNATAVIDGPCSCDLCHKTFSGIFALKAHNYYYHSLVRRTFCCKLCPRQFKWEAILKRHVNIVHSRRERRQIAVNLDSLSVQDQPALIGETRAQLRANVELTSSDGYKCTTCNKVFSSLSAVRLHRFSAHGLGPRRVCKFCNKSYRPCHFARHCCWKTKTGKRSGPVSAASADCISPSASFHRGNASTSCASCSLCQSKFSDIPSLKDHLRRLHNVYNSEKIDELLSKSGDCDDGGSDEMQLMIHEDADEKEDAVPLQFESSNNGNSSRKAECPVCHKLFKNRGSLGMHRWRHHSLQKRFCAGCRKSYLASQFSNHICSLSSDVDNEQAVAAGNSASTAALFGTSLCANLSMASSPNAATAVAAAAHAAKCDMCNRQYANDHSLKDHMRVVHGVYQRNAKSSTTRRQNDAITEQYSDSPVDSGAVRPSSSFSFSGANAQGNNNNCSSPLPPECDLPQEPSFPPRRRQATPTAGSSSSPPTSPPNDAAAAPATSIMNLVNAKTLVVDDVIATTSAASGAGMSGSPAITTVGDCECATCHRSFKNSSALRLHRFSAHGACPRRLCSKCNKSFLPWHYLRHACSGAAAAADSSGQSPDVAGPSSPKANEAVVNSFPPVEWRCSMCERRYLSRRTLKDHMRVVHGVYQRRNLDALAPVALPLNQQPTVVNEGPPVSSASSSGVLDLSCPPDAKRMRVAPGETNNLRGSHGDVSNSFIGGLSTIGLGAKSYKCGICHKLFRDIAALRKHRYSAHGTCPKRMCPRCKKFLLPWHVKRHCCWSSANGGDAVKNEAERSSASPLDENGHDGNDGIQSADGVQPKCDLCQRRYANDHTLKCHLRVIHGVYQRQKSTEAGFGSSSTANEDATEQPSPSTPTNGRLESPAVTPEKCKTKPAGMPLNLNGNECGVCHKVFQSHGAARLHLFSAHGACPKRHCPTCNKWYLPWHYSRHFCQNAAAQSAVAHTAAAVASGGTLDDTDPSELQQSQWKCESCDRQYLSHRTLKDHLRIAHGIYQTRRPSSAAGMNAQDSAKPSSTDQSLARKTPSPTLQAGKINSPSTHSPSATALSARPIPPTPGSESGGNKNPGFTVIGDPSSPMYECDICSKVFKSSSAARLHRLSGHGACPKRVCPKCKRSFLPCHFARHSCTGITGGGITTVPTTATVATVAAVSPSTNISTSTGLEWKCHLCDRRYQSSRTLKDHLRIGHGVYQTKNRVAGPTDGTTTTSDAEPLPLIADTEKYAGNARGASLSPVMTPATEDHAGNINDGDNSELQQLLSSNASPTMSPNNDNECNLCNKSFKNSSALRLHRYVTHVSRRRQLCTRCNKSFLPCHFPRHCCWSADGVRQPADGPAKKPHLESSPQGKGEKKIEEAVKSSSSIKCEFCPSRFPDEDNLKEHIQHEHEDYIGEDDANGKSTEDDDIMDQSFKAEAQDNVASPIDNMANQNYIEDEGNDDDVDIIDEDNLGNQGGAAGSANTPSNGYKCGICHMPFSNLTDVRKHRYSVHGACPKRICPKCNKAILPCHFSRHACEPAGTSAVATGNNTAPLDVPQPETVEEAAAAFEWKCDLCERRYLSRRTLNDHRRVVHGLYARRTTAEEAADQQLQFPQNRSDDDVDMAAVPLTTLTKELADAPVESQSEVQIENDSDVKMEVEEPCSPVAQQPPPAHSGATPSQKERDLRSLIVFPEPEGFGNDFLTFKSQKIREDNGEDLSFVDPLAMMDAAADEDVEAEEIPTCDADGDGSPLDGNNAGGTEQCTICMKAFKSSSALRLHRFSAHGTCPKRECPKCNKSFLPWHFTRHCCWNKEDEQTGGTANNNSNTTTTTTVGETADSAIATCELCRRTYTSARTLKEHMRTVHGVYQRRNQPATLVPHQPQSQQQPQQPQPQPQQQQSAVERPPSSSSSVMPVATPSVCEDDAATGVKQEATASGAQQNYVCPDCNASFKAPFDLLLHRLTHTGDKPFVCSDCKEAFAMPQELDVHRSSVHQK